MYGGCYLVNGVLVLIANSANNTTSYIVGYVIGIAINICLTYLAVKNTFKD